ncbi:hypothetical protein BC832DRAFT_591402 [Gaertneriomyces semiglobifer]|nr:hypothetical protein BC832DRAFT_591402 [Gaertneriomyces semiglobifer]
MTVTHIVLFKVKSDTNVKHFEEQVQSLTKVPGVQKLSFGQTFKTQRSKGYTHALVVELADKAALETYATDEHHVSVIQNTIIPGVEPDGILAMDIEN